jgi:hypothetical protein
VFGNNIFELKNKPSSTSTGKFSFCGGVRAMQGANQTIDPAVRYQIEVIIQFFNHLVPGNR